MNTTPRKMKQEFKKHFGQEQFLNEHGWPTGPHLGFQELDKEEYNLHGTKVTRLFALYSVVFGKLALVGLVGQGKKARVTFFECEGFNKLTEKEEHWYKGFARTIDQVDFPRFEMVCVEIRYTSKEKWQIQAAKMKPCLAAAA